MNAQDIIIKEIIRLESKVFDYEKRAWDACQEDHVDYEILHTFIVDTQSSLAILKSILGKIKKNK